MKSLLTVFGAFAFVVIFHLPAESGGSLSFSHQKGGKINQMGVSGEAGRNFHRLVVNLDGRALKSKGDPTQFELEGAFSSQISGPVFLRAGLLTHHTHDRASIGGELFAFRSDQSTLSFSGSYGREYPSGEFKEFLQGAPSDLVLVGARITLRWRNISIKAGADAVNDYTADETRIDGDVRVNAALGERIVAGYLFERSKRADTSLVTLGAKF